ncbi:hypothetical protein KIPB_002244 [Kipferlia bialata]|uniref:Uncharacterized protein n=1 Tax=Kipferlia bialata TaxID=797122 RepID=A0A9K3CR57_9EUKA|nr:hypothetical protein KIPB_002244 [Kipferlia bialata]|eukprot:g2244.t1
METAPVEEGQVVDKQQSGTGTAATETPAADADKAAAIKRRAAKRARNRKNRKEKQKQAAAAAAAPQPQAQGEQQQQSFAEMMAAMQIQTRQLSRDEMVNIIRLYGEYMAQLGGQTAEAEGEAVEGEEPQPAMDIPALVAELEGLKDDELEEASNGMNIFAQVVMVNFYPVCCILLEQIAKYLCVLIPIHVCCILLEQIAKYLEDHTELTDKDREPFHGHMAVLGQMFQLLNNANPVDAFMLIPQLQKFNHLPPEFSAQYFQPEMDKLAAEQLKMEKEMGNQAADEIDRLIAEKGLA